MTHGPYKILRCSDQSPATMALDNFPAVHKFPEPARHVKALAESPFKVTVSSEEAVEDWHQFLQATLKVELRWDTDLRCFAVVQVGRLSEFSSEIRVGDALCHPAGRWGARGFDAYRQFMKRAGPGDAATTKELPFDHTTSKLDATAVDGDGPSHTPSGMKMKAAAQPPSDSSILADLEQAVTEDGTLALLPHAAKYGGGISHRALLRSVADLLSSQPTRVQHLDCSAVSFNASTIGSGSGSGGGGGSFENLTSLLLRGLAGSNVQSLRLARCGLGSDDAVAIRDFVARGDASTDLKVMDLSCNAFLTEKACSALVDLTAHLDVVCDVSAPSEDTFKDGVQRVEIGQSELTSISGGGLSVWAAQLVRLPHQDSLACIDLSAVPMTNAALLGAGPRLFANELSQRAPFADVKLLLTDTAKDNKNDGLSTAFLCNAEEIVVKDKPVGDKIAFLTGFLQLNESLVSLNVSNTGMSHCGALAVANALSRSRSLQRLNVSGNRLLSHGVEAICRKIVCRDSPSIAHVDVSSTDMMKDGLGAESKWALDALTDGLAACTSVTSVSWVHFWVVHRVFVLG